MAFYEMLPGAGMPSGLQAGMDSVLNKKFGTSTTYPAEGWPDNVNLLGPLPEKTVSGAIVTFSDGADAVPLKKCEVTLSASLDGYSEIDVHSTGSNVWDEVTELGAINVVNGQNVANNNFIRSKNYIPVLPNTVYYKCAPQNILQLYYGKDKTYLSYGSWNKNTTFATPANCYFVRFYVAQEYGTTYNDDIALNYPETFTEYAPYSGTTHTATLGRTIYGGSGDVVSGEGESTEKGKWLSELTWTQNASYPHIFNGEGFTDRKKNINWDNTTCLSDRYTGYTSSTIVTQSSGIALSTGATSTRIYVADDRFETVADFVASLQNDDSFVVLPLATPETFTFDPVPIDSKLGNNTLWSEQGSIEVTYRADIALALGE